MQAALQAKFHGAREASRIEALLQNIVPGLDGLDPALPPAELVAAAVEANVRWTLKQVRDTPEAQSREKDGSRKIVGAVFEFATGRVRFLD